MFKLLIASVLAVTAFFAPLRAWYAAFFWVGGTDPILTIDNDTLTTYQLTSATTMQDIRPRVTQRGVNVDGSLRVAPSYDIALNGNPFGSPWSGESFSSVKPIPGTQQSFSSSWRNPLLLDLVRNVGHEDKWNAAPKP